MRSANALEWNGEGTMVSGDPPPEAQSSHQRWLAALWLRPTWMRESRFVVVVVVGENRGVVLVVVVLNEC